MYLSKEVWVSVVNEELEIGKLPMLPCSCCHRVLLEVKRELVKLFEVVKRNPPDFSKISVAVNGNLIDALAAAAESIAEATTRRFRFSATLICPGCREPTIVAGDAKTRGPDGGPVYIRIKNTWPELQVFELKSTYPAGVTSEIQKSFIPFLRDAASTGSRVRTAIELLLDELKVARLRTQEDGQVKRKQNGTPLTLSLSERLKELENREPYVAKLLGAIKQLGNEATHGGDLLYSDLLDAFDLMHHVLEELYVERPKRLAKLQTSKHISNKYQ
jgi:hypothetical protein